MELLGKVDIELNSTSARYSIAQLQFNMRKTTFFNQLSTRI